MSKGEYVLTEDTGAILQELYGAKDKNANAKYLGKLATILSESTIDADVRVFEEDDIDAALSEKIVATLDSDPSAVCVIIDRFLARSTEEDPQYADRIRRFSITRSYGGEKISRIGKPSLDDQVNAFALDFTDIDQTKVYLVDEGLFTGGTVGEVQKRLMSKGFNVVGALGFLQSNEAETNIMSVNATMPVPNLYEWADIRDFSMFGGKINKKSMSGRSASAVPYIAPWADGRTASLDMLPDFFDISNKMLSAQIKMLESYETTFGPLTVRDIVKANFAVPTNIEKSIPITINTGVVDYLRSCQELVEREARRDVLVIDMDGTLYDLLPEADGSGYQASLLRKQVEDNALAFIAAKTGVLNPEEELQRGLNNPIGISAYLSDTYGIKRQDYYDTVWNINPEGLVGVEESLKEVLMAASTGTFGSTEKKLVLLTSAPNVWVTKVLNYLGVSSRFEAIYTGEMYGKKPEVMQMLAARYNPKNMISIGDQLLTDIEPAQKLGMSTRLVSSAADTARVIREILS